MEIFFFLIFFAGGIEAVLVLSAFISLFMLVHFMKCHGEFSSKFNLNRSTYQPFTKQNTSLQYCEGNHPPITIKNIPAGINKRLSSLSSDKASFDQAAPLY